ncbi:YhcH/YjgK/YiaL family protein [Dethiosulfatibacter aminovorans DSM 17477]|uniref:YhcH/YjgK/YiaL family protein n=1 Tax=Dethiosulfatibacter aminovorans DSM 17477 TaxID=1121476 RepID=A0A1M6E729_9FIRM|nr:YhcH/YjgK/YiaL family protein [Dethiosulfatibacter aminovorans]SHI81088.1 YhcH/YjgK/YiaL family protein [Dethiosulfatibacter aminovorans DSM 17477]
MITDSINNFKLYQSMHEGLRKAIEFVEESLKENKEDGYYAFDDSFYALICSYDTLVDRKEYESHDKYIDVQFIIEGEEAIYFSDRSSMERVTDYDEKDDFTLYKGKADGVVNLKKGRFAIFYPDDVHMPKCAIDNKSSHVRKIITKIKI